MNHYIKYSLENADRLLSLLDTTPFSESTGSFHRNYWHFKTSHFSNAAMQQGVLSLAKLFKLNVNGNTFYENEFILDQIKNAIKFTRKIQHNDGSFDEWYINERGWAGPTGYISHALCETYNILENDLDNESKDILVRTINRASDHLILSDELHPLSNHIAIAALPLFEAAQITNTPRYLEKYNFLLGQIYSLFEQNEGWGKEYDGADPGYQSATVSFLSRIHKVNQDKNIKELCLKSLDFIKDFCYPDGSFAGNIGSRHTTNIFYYGVEYWNALGEKPELSCWIKNNFLKQTNLQHHDDNYFIYRLHELLDAGAIYKEVEDDSPIYYRSKTYNNAGIKVVKNQNYYCAANFKRGGALQIFSVKNNELIHYDSGIIANIDNKTYTSLTYNQEYKVKCTSVTGKLSKTKSNLFSPLKGAFFESFMAIFGNHYKAAYYLKNLIRKILIFGYEESSHSFERSLKFNKDSVEIETNINLNKPANKIIIGGEFFTRFVPQSKYFRKKVHNSNYAKTFNNKQVINQIETVKVN